MLNGLKNFLQFINDNWTTLIIIISLVIAIAEKIKSYCKKSEKEKIETAKAQISQVILKLITDAEKDYNDWEKAGSIKRAQVIQKVFTDYPIFSKIGNQEEIVAFIDDAINNALKELRKIVAQNNQTADEASKKEE